MVGTFLKHITGENRATSAKCIAHWLTVLKNVVSMRSSDDLLSQCRTS